MFNKKTVRDVDVRGKTVLLRADYNAPLKKDENDKTQIADDFRIRASLPTLEYLLNNGAKKIIIISHLGRPEGVESFRQGLKLKRSGEFPDDNEYSMSVVAKHLAYLLNEKMGRRIKYYFPMVPFYSDAPGGWFDNGVASDGSSRTQRGGFDECDFEVAFCENLRFSKEEKANLLDFAKKIVEITGANLFVQDGFGVVHRAHASTSALAQILPSVAGLLLEEEVSKIQNAMQKPEKPVVSILGGAKISDKLPLIKKFIEISDYVIVGGAMANAFYKYHGFEIGKSKFEEGQEQAIFEIEELARKKFGADFREKFLISSSVAVRSLNGQARGAYIDKVRKDDVILDCGTDFVKYLKNDADLFWSSKTIIWNGVLGYIEDDVFAQGSELVALEIMEAAKRNGATSIICGGDTAGFVLNRYGSDGFSLISTGGGAALELMSGKKLPGLEVLPDK